MKKLEINNKNIKERLLIGLQENFIDDLELTEEKRNTIRDAIRIIDAAIEEIGVVKDENGKLTVRYFHKEYIEGVFPGSELVTKQKELGREIQNILNRSETPSQNLLDEWDRIKTEASKKFTDFFNESILKSSPITDGVMVMALGSLEAVKEYLDEQKKNEGNKPIKIEPDSTPSAFRRPSFVNEQILQFNHPSKKKKGKFSSDQLSIFDQLNPYTQAAIQSAALQGQGVTIEWVNKRGFGIKLTRAEHKLLLCLSKLLHKNSQTFDPKAEDYYTGNVNPNEKVLTAKSEDLRIATFPQEPIDGQPQPDLILKTATLDLSLYEITKEYKGGASFGGEDQKIVFDLLIGLAHNSTKKMLVKYRREGPGPIKGQRVVYTREGFEPMLNIFGDEMVVMTEADRKVVSKATQVTIRLHPIFRDQIDEKYIEYPDDILSRIYEANGGNQNVSEVTFRLIDHLAHARSNKTYSSEIYLDKLQWKMAEDWMLNPKRGKGHVKKGIDKAIETATKIGLLLSHQVIPGATGEPKYVFKINKNWC